MNTCVEAVIGAILFPQKILNNGIYLTWNQQNDSLLLVVLPRLTRIHLVVSPLLPRQQQHLWSIDALLLLRLPWRPFLLGSLLILLLIILVLNNVLFLWVCVIISPIFFEQKALSDGHPLIHRITSYFTCYLISLWLTVVVLRSGQLFFFFYRDLLFCMALYVNLYFYRRLNPMIIIKYCQNPGLPV